MTTIFCFPCIILYTYVVRLYTYIHAYVVRCILAVAQAISNEVQGQNIIFKPTYIPIG